ncbi:MAG: ABC transporter ATP-binding protein [Oligoflexales bacterium]|nr:ABC transporter ATP-binding protein [Oligoflexales bacterium]
MKISFKNVEKKYGDFSAVKDLNLVIENGTLHFLLGPSGCGKTTTLRMLAGLEKPSSGQIFFDNEDVTNKSSAERNIGMVFQNYALWPHMTVYKNIEYGLKLRKLSKIEIKKRIDDVLDVTQLTRFAERLPGQLSGGQQQRVALARALAIRPSVLLLDEPLSNLDAKLRHEMRDNITKIFKQTGITMVYVTHDQKEALSMASEISVMFAGELIQSDNPRNLYKNPQTAFIAGFIGETNLVEAEFISVENGICQISSPLGKLQARLVKPEKGGGTPKYKKGDKVFLSIRPEAFSLNEGGSNLNRVSGILKHVTYLGDSEQLDVSFMGGDQHFKVNLIHGPDRIWQENEQLHFFLAAADILVLPHETLGHGT